MHSSNSDFYFGLLRVSVAQLLAARGFDRTKASTVDTLADLHVRFMGLLVKEVRALAAARCDGDDDSVALQDLTLAMANLGLLKPNEALDVYGENPQLATGDAALCRFKQWCEDQQTTFEVEEILPVHLAEKEAAQSQETQQQAQEQGPGVFALPQTTNAASSEETAAKVAEEERRREELMEELEDSGDTRDWLSLQVARQRVQIYNKRYAREIAVDPEEAPNSVPDFTILPLVPGLRYSALRNTCTSSGAPAPAAGAEGDTRLQNETVPSSAPAMDASHDDDELTTTIEDDKTRVWQDRAAKLTQLLPAMAPHTRLDNITLSYEQDGDDDIASDSDSDNAIEEVDIPVADMNPDNITFDEFGDMDDAFQRRASLDYGAQMF